jgi:8-oxo-dGTP pyrophosphatase MutT (NUDIX family)
MQEMTWCFLVRGNKPEEILLGHKKVGFGGKVEDGETVAMAAIRESG